MSNPTVTFLPLRKRIRVAPETSLLEAAAASDRAWGPSAITADAARNGELG